MSNLVKTSFSIDKTCKYENILMSVAGHLVVVALMITSFAIVIRRAELVTPDRVEIVEIDLKNIRVSSDETKLYNTNVPENKTDKLVQERVAEKNNDIIQEKNIEKPSMIDETVNKKAKETDAKTEVNAKSDAKDVTKKKTVVRVNREVLSLDRTLTVSVIDALRVAMTRCWVIDSSRSDIVNIRAVAHLKMRPNGTVASVWFESETQAETDVGFAYVLDTVRSAIQTCEPFDMLPKNEFNLWESIQITFYPAQGKVM